MHACTIIARNYLAHARVLASSYLEHHPEGTFSVLVLDVDETVDPAAEGFEVIDPEQVVDPAEFRTMSLIYSVMELATAVKPKLLEYLMAREDGPVIYLDPDIQVFGSLAPVFRQAAEHGIVLTPHTLDPVPRDGRNPSETFILQSGVYNLGFIGVAPGSEDFLAWWWERLRRDCIVQPEAGLFVDQRWVDFAPALFDPAILRDPGLNVAYWNLATRPVRRDGGGWAAGGSPLVFFHFSGYDPAAPWLLSKHQGDRPRILLSEHPELKELCDAYGRALLDRGFDLVSRIPYGLGTLPNGLVVDRWMRRLYRAAIRDPDPAAGPPPNPFDDPDGFLAWVDRPAADGPPWLTRYLRSIWEHRWDLQEAFPDLEGDDGDRYRSWLEERGRMEANIPERLMPREARPAAGGRTISPSPVGPGINVAGYLRAELGVGEAARQVIAAAAAAGEPVATYTFGQTRSRQEHPFEDLEPVAGSANPYDVNLVTVNADQMDRFARAVGPAFFSDRTTVGYWAWEVEQFPPTWPRAFELVDEIWMNSEFAAAALRKATDVPVHALPLTVTAPEVPDLGRADLGLPDGFLFLFSFDFASVFERKNPLAVVRAFTSAFAPGEGPTLVLKSINGERHLRHLERLRHEVAGRPDILLLDGYLPAGHKNALTALCDAYVSLHRAEGFGLTMAEAMALGKPTIATAYSGNLEFMTEENSYLVRWDPAEVPPGADPYPPGSPWAEPDVEHAAALMRRVADDPDEAAAIGERARSDIAAGHGPEARAERLRELVDAIRERRTPAGGDVPAPAQAPPAPAAPTEPARVAAARAAAREQVRHPHTNLRPGQGAKNALRRSVFATLRPFAEEARQADAAVYEYTLALEGHLDDLVKRLTVLREQQGESLRHEADARMAALTADLEGRIAAVADAARAAAAEAGRAAAEQAALHRGDVESLRGDLSALTVHIARLTEDVTSDRESLRAAVADLQAASQERGRLLERMLAEVPAPLTIPGIGGRLRLKTHEVPDVYVSRYLRRDGIWEPLATRSFLEPLRPGAVAVDVGANLGYYTVLAGAAVGAEGRVVAVEPEPRNAALLEENVRLNGFDDRVEIVAAAAGEAEGSTLLYLGEANLGDHRAFDSGDGRKAIEVPIVALDDLPALAGRVDLVKIDVQGAEAAVLRGARRLIERNRDHLVMLVEFWPQGIRLAGDDPAEVIAALEGFRVWSIDEEAGALRPATREDLEAFAADTPEEIDEDRFLHLLVRSG
jgi:FkbM family methyltransferase